MYNSKIVFKKNLKLSLINSSTTIRTLFDHTSHIYIIIHFIMNLYLQHKWGEEYKDIAIHFYKRSRFNLYVIMV